MMVIGSEEWRTLVEQGAAQLGVIVHHQQTEQFSRHARWLMEWNRKINLTAITDPREVAIKHFVDAIAPLEHIPDSGHLLDMGTGGGFPGIPLKIMRPGQPMTLIDSVRKKVNFVRYVIHQLELAGIEALHTRAEALADGPKGGQFDIIVCRALSDLRTALALARPLLAPGGKMIFYQGPSTGDDSDDNRREPLLYDGFPYQCTSYTFSLPYSDFTRRVIIVQI